MRRTRTATGTMRTGSSVTRQSKFAKKLELGAAGADEQDQQGQRDLASHRERLSQTTTRRPSPGSAAE
jgi:hypothetical protein